MKSEFQNTKIIDNLKNVLYNFIFYLFQLTIKSKKLENKNKYNFLI